MPCSACGHSSTNSKPPVLILGQQHIKVGKEKVLNQRNKEKKEKVLNQHIKIYKEKIRNLQQKTKIKKSIFKQRPTSKFNMLKKMNYY